MRMISSITVIAAALLVTSCDGAANPENVASANQSNCTIVDYGGGVLYFDCIGSNFGNALSQYRREHPTMRVESSHGNGNGGYGRDQGYFVIVSPAA